MLVGCKVHLTIANHVPARRVCNAAAVQRNWIGHGSVGDSLTAVGGACRAVIRAEAPCGVRTEAGAGIYIIATRGVDEICGVGGIEGPALDAKRLGDLVDDGLVLDRRRGVAGSVRRGSARIEKGAAERVCVGDGASGVG